MHVKHDPNARYVSNVYLNECYVNHELNALCEYNGLYALRCYVKNASDV